MTVVDKVRAKPAARNSLIHRRSLCLLAGCAPNSR
jgi:hypothetical protein